MRIAQELLVTCTLYIHDKLYEKKKEKITISIQKPYEHLYCLSVTNDWPYD